MVNRRDVLKGAAAWPVTVSGGSTMLLWSSEARAWVPVALAVAQVGFQLYQMSRSGGGGIGKLLAAQVEMLRAINAQLREIGQTVNQIYAGVEELQNMVEVLPTRVTREIYREEVRSVTEYGSRLLDNGLTNTQARGLAAAIELDAGASQQALERLAPAVSAVMRDPSVINVPLICLAWYTEYQMLNRYVVFNPARIASTAKMYRNYFQQSVATLTQELAKIDAEVAGLSERIASFPVFPNTDCIEELRYMMRHRACGSHGDGDCYSGDVTFTAVSYNSTLELQENGLAQFLIAASDLGAAGVKISEALESARVPRWNYSRETSRKYFSAVDREPPAYREYIERIGARQCAPGRTAQVAGFYGIQDEVKRAADDLRVRTIVNNHLLLAASEALRSCTTIAERVSAVQV